ncbi:hypothetical protein ACFL2Z_02315 [Candidatus Eisenbacteria bacterium]|uniref:Uncharacterized protein n=1 Tax=Eiseniibacteriota bacterium TaxID=2212470 RepID=A0ABV6YPB2_UNCEI
MRNFKGLFLFLFFLLPLLTHQPGYATTVCDVQDYDPDTGFSVLNGQTVTVTGVITCPPGIFVTSQTSYFIRGIDNDPCGINLFTFGQSQARLSLGDTLTVTGSVEEYVLSGGDGAVTEITYSEGGLGPVRAGDPLSLEPEVMLSGDVSYEMNEGRLVRVTGKMSGRDGSREITVNDGSGDIAVFDMARAFEGDPTWNNLQMGDIVTVTGIVSQAGPGPPYLTGYSIWPRSPEAPYEDVKTPQCIPDSSIVSARLEVVDSDSNRVNIFCPECPGGTSRVFIKYAGPDGWRTELRIYDTAGRLAATLSDYYTECGEVTIEWTGRNELMERLPVGLYYIIVTATDPGNGSVTQTMVPLVIGKRL